MDKPSIQLPRGNRSGGFSLVEVALAIGIIAFAFVALFSLIPTGLTQMRTAIDSSNETRIVQNVVAKALSTNYNQLNTLEGTIYYFDEEGLLVDTSEAPVPARKEARLYAARVFLQPGVVEESAERKFAFSQRLVIALGHLLTTRAGELTAIDTYDRLQTMLNEKNNPKQNVNVRSVTIAKTDGK